MFRKLWWKSPASKSHASRRGPQRGRRRALAFFRPRAEYLEDRTLLANDITIGGLVDLNIDCTTVAGSCIAAGLGATLSVPTLLTQLLAGNLNVDATDTTVVDNGEPGVITWAALSPLDYDPLTATRALTLTAGTTVTLNSALMDSVPDADALNFTVIGDDIAINAAIDVNAVTGTVTLRPQSAATVIRLGDDFGGLGLTNAELDQITAGTLNIGDTTNLTNTGDIQLAGAIDQAGSGYTFLVLATLGAITDNTGAELADITVDFLSLVAGNGIGSADELDVAVGGLGAFTGAGNIQLAITGVALTFLSGVVTSGGNFNLVTAGGLSIDAAPLDAGAGDVTLNAAGAVTQTTAITAGRLQLLGAGSFTLTNASNAVGTLAANTTGTISYRDQDDLTVGTVTTAGIITVGTNVRLRTGGALAITNPINVGTADLTLEAGGVVVQTAAITAGGLELLGTGPFNLTLATNNVARLAANTTGAISYRDANGLEVGTVNTVGITSTDDAVSLQTGGNLVLNAPIDLIDVGTAALTLTSAGTITQPAGTITAGLLTTSSVGGTTLGQMNAVTGFNATNTGGGNVSLANTAALTITGGSQSGGGSLTVVNMGNPIIVSGAITVGGLGNLTLRTMSSGAITINAKLTAGGDVTLDAVGTLTINAAIDPLTVTLESDSDVFINAPVVATNTITVVAGQNTGIGNVMVSGTGSLTTLAAGTISVMAGSGMGNITLAGNVLSGGTVTLTANGAPGNITLSALLTAVGALTINVGGNLTLNGATLTAATATATGSAGTNTLTMTYNSSSTFTINAAGGGNVANGSVMVPGSLVFSLFENLVGGSGNDAFNLVTGGSLAGSVSGLMGTDTLSYAGFTGPVTITVTGTGPNGFDGSATALTMGFFGIASLIASATPGVCDSFTGLNAVSTWNLGIAQTYVSGGFTLALSGFELLIGGNQADTFNITANTLATLRGGDGGDAFNLSGTSVLTGCVPGEPALDGQGGTDTLSYAASTGPVSVTLTGADATGFRGSGTGLNANFAGTDAIIGSATPGVCDQLTGLNATSTWNLGAAQTYASGGFTLTLSSFELLVGGTGADTFNITANTLATLRGGAGNDLFNLFGTAVLTGCVPGEPALDGQAGTDTLSYAGYAGPVTVTVTGVDATGFSGTATGLAVPPPPLPPGFRGIDAVVGSGTPGVCDQFTGLNAASTWTLGATQTYSSGGFTLTLSSFELLIGGSGVDTFNITANTLATLRGGAGNDLFNLFGTAVLTGCVPGEPALDGQAGTDTLSYAGYAGPVSVTLMGAGATGFRGSGTGLVSNFAGIDGIIGSATPGGCDQLTGLNATSTWNLGAAQTYASGGFTLNIGGFELLIGGSGVDTFNITANTLATLRGGAGDDAFNLAGTAVLTGCVPGEPALDGQAGADTLSYAAYAGPVTVTVTAADATGFRSSGTGLVSNFAGIDTLVGSGTPGATDQLTVTGTGGNDDFTLTATTLTAFGASLTYSGFEQLTINGLGGNDAFTVNGTSTPTLLSGGDGDDTFTVNATAAAGPLTLNGNAGNDTFTVNIEPAAGQVLAGTVTVNGSEDTDALTVNGNPTAADTIAVTNTTVSRTGSATITYVMLEQLTVNGLGGNDTFNVQSTGIPTTVNGNQGDDTINVGSAANQLDGIQGTLTVHGNEGSNTLNLNDQGSTAAGTYSLAATQFQRVIPLTALVTYGTFQALNLRAGSADDTVNIYSTFRDTVYTVAAGAGSDTINLGSNPDAPTSSTLDGFSGALSVNGNDGVDRLNLNDQGTTAASRYLLTANAAGQTLFQRLSAVTAQVTYGTLEALTLNAGTGSDVVILEHTHAGVTTVNANTGNDRACICRALEGPTSVNGEAGNDEFAFADGASLTSGLVSGGGGTDLLNYLVYTTALVVNLAAGTATGTGGVTGVEYVVGGSGNDTLIGENGPNQLEGRAGNDTINGLGGNDILLGGTGNDLLLGGEGDDVIASEDGDDTIEGEAGNDAILGGLGNDILRGGDGNDRIDGGSGVRDPQQFRDPAFLRAQEVLTEGVNSLDGGAGNDVLFARSGMDTLLGGSGRDVLVMRQCDDFFAGRLTLTPTESAAEEGDVITTLSLAVFGNAEQGLGPTPPPTPPAALGVVPPECNVAPVALTLPAASTSAAPGTPSDRLAVLPARFLDSVEARTNLIRNYYVRFLGRAAEAAGLQHWLTVLASGGRVEDVLIGVLASAEYFDRHGGTDAGFLRGLYQEIFGRLPAQAEVDAWLPVLQTGSRSVVVRGFVTSAEFRTGLIQGWYQRYLGRAADTAGLHAWLEQLRRGATQDQIQAVILASPEYRQTAARQFSTQSGDADAAYLRSLYQDLLGRLPAQAEAEGWLRALGQA